MPIAPQFRAILSAGSLIFTFIFTGLSSPAAAEDITEMRMDDIATLNGAQFEVNDEVRCDARFQHDILKEALANISEPWRQ